jgi:hypothetical protein
VTDTLEHYSWVGCHVRIFDPLLYESDGAICRRGEAAVGRAELCSAAAFALVERPTGIELTRSWLLDLPHPAYRRDPEL